MFRLTYDGSIVDEPRYMVMGGNTDPIATALKDTYSGRHGAGRRCGDRGPCPEQDEHAAARREQQREQQ